MTLKELRANIKREAPHVGKKPYSHNIVGLCLRQIAEKFGKDEANKALGDFNLTRKGFNEE